MREARLREKPAELAPEDVPFSEIRIPARFLEEHPRVAQLLIDSVAEGIFATPGAIDYDIRDAFDSNGTQHDDSLLMACVEEG